MHITEIPEYRRTAAHIASLADHFPKGDVYHQDLIRDARAVSAYYNLRKYIYLGSTQSHSIWRSNYQTTSARPPLLVQVDRLGNVTH